MKFTRIVKKSGKWLGYSILGLLFILLVLYGFAYWQTEKRLNTVYETELININIPEDSASIARGNHLFTVHACRDCHSINLGGQVMMEKPLVGRFIASNLTKGNGGIPADYSDQDWLRALKLGLNKQGKPLIGMPSNESTQLPDQDLADIIAYCKSRPPVDNELEEIKIGPLIRVLTAIGEVKLFPAEQIAHKIDYVKQPIAEVSAEFGASLAINCMGCHNSNFQGGPSPFPDHPPVPDISSTGRIGKWTEDQFIRTLREGVTPEGHSFDNKTMPWERFSEFSDVELKALRVYLLSFPQKKSM